MFALNHKTIKKFNILMTLILFTSNISAQSLPTDISTLFSGSGNCAVCHIEGNGAFVTESGTKISPTTLWRSTMMANAAKDPLWQAKVSAEVSQHPLLQSVIEDKCATCHSPMSRTEAIYNGTDYITLEEALSDPLGLDGISCALCHQIQNTLLGSEQSYSGQYIITNAHDIFGPYASPTTAPMFNQTGYMPKYSDHVNKSEICATCHNLFTPFVDNDGEVAGYFPEQTPYSEWENSVYAIEGTECQTCHMPSVNESMKISANPGWLTTQRTPIWEHEFVGGNIFMNKILKDHGSEIGIDASNTELDSTLSKMNRMLKEKSINLSLKTEIMNDSLLIKVEIENLTGHKFPTGFPSRRAWLHIRVENNENHIVFESGSWDSTGNIIGINNDYEPHYDTIISEDQVQIYQSIMKDVDGNTTYTLLRGAEYAKDNRLPPKGFNSLYEDYETVKISGEANRDIDFNQNNETEGSGKDIVKYLIGLDDPEAEYLIKAEVLYQSISPKFAEHLFTLNTGYISQFKNYYDNTDRSPVIVRSIFTSTLNTNIKDEDNMSDLEFKLKDNYPNPFNPITTISYDLPEAQNINLQIYDIKGQLIETLYNGYKGAGNWNVIWDASDQSSGVYIYRLQYGDNCISKKMLLLK